MHPLKIAFIQFTTPATYPPVMNAATIVATERGIVSLWGVGAFGAANDLRMNLRPNMTQHLMPYTAPGWRQKILYLRFVLACFFRTLFWRPNFVYVSDFWAYPIGWLVSFIPGVNVIAHEHDTPPLDSKRQTQFFQWMRRKLFKRAACTVVPQTQRGELVQQNAPPKRLLIVWNCPRKSEIVSIPTKQACGSFFLWYHGSIVSGQFPEEVIIALAMLPERVHLRFAGYETIGQKGYVERLFQRATSLGVRHRVTFEGTMATRKELFLAASQCDLGLALFARDFREAMVGASNKPFDYLACGLGVLVNDTPEWINFFANCPSVRSCNPGSPESIRDAVLRILDLRDSFIEVRRQGQAMIDKEWNYEHQFAPVLEVLKSNC